MSQPQPGTITPSASLYHRYEVECFRACFTCETCKAGHLHDCPNKYLAWREETPNTVVNEGLDDLLDKYFKGSGYTASHFVGLLADASGVGATDTLSTYNDSVTAGDPEEVTTYSEGTRQTLTLGSVSGQSVDNSASKASFSINGDATVDGAFIATDNTKGGTTGTLYGAASFTSRTVANGDTLNITATLTASSA